MIGGGSPGAPAPPGVVGLADHRPRARYRVYAFQAYLKVLAEDMAVPESAGSS